MATLTLTALGNEIRHWYNGYNWGGTGVYNPFDALLLTSFEVETITG
ncbi:MAG: putative AAA-ATPase [Pseudomonadota bacterium]|jgi:hypothetical protein